MYARNVESGRSSAASHIELTELPPTLENLDAKMNHLIVRLEVGIAASQRAERAAEKARDLAEKARDAARNSGSIAVRAVQGVETLPRWQRLLSIAAGGVMGGAAASAVLWCALAVFGAAGLTSCLPGR